MKPGGSVLVLVNPISGKGRGARAVGPLARAFEQNGLAARVELLPGPGSAAALIRDLAGPHAAVAAAGGDGTVNEIAAALLAEGKGRPLGLIPLGLSNCLARHLRLPLDLTGAAGVIARGRLTSLDAALAEGRCVVSFLGAGFDAAVVDRVARGRRGGIRNWAYVRAAFSAILKPGWPELFVKVDGRRIEGGYFQVIFSQVTNYAHYFSLPAGPGFRAYLFRGPGLVGIFRALCRSGPRRDLGRACDLSVRVRERLEIRSAAQAFFQVDGEAGGRLPVVCQVRPSSLEVFVP